MIDALSVLVVVLGLAIVTAVLVGTYPRTMRPWVWIAFGEYLVCSAAQVVYSRVIVVEGGDTVLYARTGAELAKFLDANFSFTWREMLALLLQQPSKFDDVVIGGGGNNTASMHAVCGWLIYFFRSGYGAHVFVSGLAFFGVLSIFKAFSNAYPEVPPLRLFVATVLFPSVAFWTSALHKEAFCVAGMGALLAAWRAAYAAKIRAVPLALIGVPLVLLFRAPAMPPLLLGLVVYFAADRFRKTRGADVVMLGPVYLALAFGALALGMIALARVSPQLSLDQLGESVARRQQSWALSKGGSSIEGEALPQTLAGQIMRFPLALLNALFRPQLFDVNNIAALLSAIEMTTITWIIIRTARRHGIGKLLVRIQQSPFLLMCAVITLVGCTFVGLVTLNLGSLSRYRVPFLPFYGTLLAVLSAPDAPAQVIASVPARLRKRVPLRRKVARAASGR